MMVLGLLASCFFAGLALAQPAAKKGKPAVLTMAIADNGTGVRIEAINPVAAYLSKELGIQVNTTTRETATGLLNGLKDGSIDIAYINGFGYVLGVADSLPLRPLVVAGFRDGTPNSYNSCIFTSAGSPIKSISDLVARSQQYSFLFVNPTSTSGHLVPRLYLGKMGIKQAEVDLRELDFGDSHYNTIEKVLAGEADAGAAAYNIVQSKLASGEIKKEEINILWVSENITQEPVVVSQHMDAKLQKKIQQALLQMDKKNPALWQHIQQNFSAKGATNYVPAKDAYYNSIRNVSDRIDDLLFILNFYIN
jgi:phosphonate transport system substrate-binding protein